MLYIFNRNFSLRTSSAGDSGVHSVETTRSWTLTKKNDYQRFCISPSVANQGYSVIYIDKCVIVN